jgi:mono/diheme cytochrome c family protein
MMPLPSLNVTIVFIAAICAFIGTAHAAGDPTRGRALARTWCSSCHMTEPSNTGKDLAPSFLSIAKRGHPDQLKARAFLNAPHPPMPDFNLSRNQIDDIVAYLQSLASPAPRGNRTP